MKTVENQTPMGVRQLLDVALGFVEDVQAKENVKLREVEALLAGEKPAKPRFFPRTFMGWFFFLIVFLLLHVWWIIVYALWYIYKKKRYKWYEQNECNLKSQRKMLYDSLSHLMEQKRQMDWQLTLALDDQTDKSVALQSHISLRSYVYGFLDYYHTEKQSLQTALKSEESVEVEKRNKEKIETLETKIEEAERKINSINQSCFRSLADDLKTSFALPVSYEAIHSENYTYCVEWLNHALETNRRIKNERNALTRRKKFMAELQDDKMKFFYKVSLRGETANEEVYGYFANTLTRVEQTKEYALFRRDNDATLLAEFTETITSLSYRLEVDEMSPLIDELNSVCSMDTENFLGFTDVSKLSHQTREIEDIYKEAVSVYQRYDEDRTQIMKILEYVRLCAYRNIYLGVELINYIRNNAGGGSLSTVKDDLDMKDADLNISINSNDIKFDFMKNFSAALDQFGFITKSKDVQKLVMNNMKTAAAGVAVIAAVSYLSERSEKISANNKAQKQMIESISGIADGYQDGQVALKRSVEIVKAIAKANKGFMNIYQPLQRKVFEQDDLAGFTMRDLQQLAKATQEYNQISKSKL